MHRNQAIAPGGQRSATPSDPIGTNSTEGEVPRQREPRGGRLVRLNTSCPRCGSRPALRVTEDLVRGMNAPGELTRIGTYQCHRRGCGTIYDLYVDPLLLEMQLGGGTS